MKRGGEGGRTALALRARETGSGSASTSAASYVSRIIKRRLGVRPGQFPAAERCFEETLSLPIYPDLTDAEGGPRGGSGVRTHLMG